MLGDQVFYTISEQIVHQIKEDIFNGKLKVGESLKEVPMAKKYNVSRGPVRDAFKILSKEGFLVATPNVGVTVAPPPSSEVMAEIILLRRQLERFALERGISVLDDDDLSRMEFFLGKMREASEIGDAKTLMNNDIAFHSVVVKKYDDRHLYGIWNELVFRMMFNYNRLTNLKESCEEHSAILEAIKSRDQNKAVELLEMNIQ